MIHSSRLYAATIALTILVGPARAFESPDPKDRVPAKGLANLPTRNPVNLLERNLPTHWSAAPDEKPKNIKWSADLGTRTFGSPVVADGRIFVATNNGRPRDKAVKGKKAVLMALRESDGKFLWQITHDCPDCSIYCPGDPKLLMCTPTVDGERIYYTTPVGEIICAACADGKILWRHHALKDLKEPPNYRCAASPLVFGDLVFITNGNGVDEDDKLLATTAPCFLALDKLTGKVVWESRLASANIIVGQWSSPTVAVVHGSPQIIFAGGDGVIYAFEPANGKLLWYCNCLPARKKREAFAPIDNYFVANPVVVGTRLYIGMGVHPNDQKPAPRASWFLCLNVALLGDVSFKSYDANSPDNKNSALIWAFGGPIQPPPRGRQVRLGPVASAALVHDGLVYVAEYDGYLHCLDANTGGRYWVDDLRSHLHAPPYWADGKVYLGTDDGEVKVYAHGKAGKLLATNEMDQSIQSTPAVSSGVIYVMTREKLFAIGSK